MRKLIILLLILAAGFSSRAQYTGYSPVADLAKFKTDFSAATQKTLSIKSDFVQEKNLSMLSEKIISRGKFWFKKESQVRMEYNHPYQYLMILNKDKVFVKDGKVWWKCLNCGYVYESEKALENCPACLHPKSFMQVREENY